MIAGIIFLIGLLVVVFGIAADRRRVFWRDARRRGRRGGHLPIRFSGGKPPAKNFDHQQPSFPASTTVLPAYPIVLPAQAGITERK